MGFFDCAQNDKRVRLGVPIGIYAGRATSGRPYGELLGRVGERMDYALQERKPLPYGGFALSVEKCCIKAVYNPSVNYVDSSLYTREPLVGGLGICGVSKFLVSTARFFTALRFVLNDNEEKLKKQLLRQFH